MAMTPMGTSGYVVTKVIVALAVAVVPMAVVFLVGLGTSATMDDAWRWFATAGIIVASSVVFALYGLAAGLLFRSEGAVGAAVGAAVSVSVGGASADGTSTGAEVGATGSVCCGVLRDASGLVIDARSDAIESSIAGELRMLGRSRRLSSKTTGKCVCGACFSFPFPLRDDVRFIPTGISCSVKK